MEYEQQTAGKVRILVVEDELIIAKGIERRLTALGYSVIDTVASGEDAVKRALETVPDLMVHRADEALYRAKNEGRNRACIENEGGSEVLGKLD